MEYELTYENSLVPSALIQQSSQEQQLDTSIASSKSLRKSILFPQFNLCTRAIAQNLQPIQLCSTSVFFTRVSTGLIRHSFGSAGEHHITSSIVIHETVSTFLCKNIKNKLCSMVVFRGHHFREIFGILNIYVKYTLQILIYFYRKDVTRCSEQEVILTMIACVHYISCGHFTQSYSCIESTKLWNDPQHDNHSKVLLY